MRRRPDLHGVRRCLLPAALMLGVLGPALAARAADGGGKLDLRLRSRVGDPKHEGRFEVAEKAESWDPKRTAFLVCDMWDLHHCLNAVRRGAEMAPTMDRVLKEARGRGAIVIHAPSDCVAAYKDHPARKRAVETPRSKALPPMIGTWCYKIPSEEKGVYPIDQTDGGEDDDPAEHKEWEAKLSAMGRNPKAPWKSQTDLLTIDAEKDYISADGPEVWSILERQGVENVVLLGVHLNMCVLGRPFGLRQMAKNGKNVALMRDMTDTMYNPARAPYVGHFAGTDLMIEHVEKFVCPTITSDQLLGGAAFKFKDDKRPLVACVISEDEYDTAASLPAFASTQLTKDYRVGYILADPTEPNTLPGLDRLGTADVALISVRRRLLPKAQLDAIRKFVADGKPVVGIRTASHAFAPRGDAKPPEGRDAWAGFDAEVLGGNYHGHHGEGPKVAVTPAPGAGSHAILKGVDPAKILGHGSLYKVAPLAGTATPLLVGSIPGQPAEPVAWVNEPAIKGRVFYTSLGQIDDFSDFDFNKMLRNAIDWAVGR